MTTCLRVAASALPAATATSRPVTATAIAMRTCDCMELSLVGVLSEVLRPAGCAGLAASELGRLGHGVQVPDRRREEEGHPEQRAAGADPDRRVDADRR